MRLPKITLPSLQALHTTPGSGGNPFAKTITRTRRLRWLATGAAIIIITAGLSYYFYVAGRGSILILDTTPNITITLNNQKVTSVKEARGYRIPAYAGKYRLQIVKPNYLPFNQDIQLGRGQEQIIRPAFAFQATSQKTEVSTVDFVRPSLDQKFVFYLGDNHKTIYRMNIAQQVKEPLTDKPLTNVENVEWSSEPTVALVTTTDGVYLREIPKYDYVHQTLVKLGGRELISPVWDPLDPNRIAMAYYPASGEKSLVFTDKRLSSLSRKADISAIVNPRLVWSPDDSYLLLIGRSADQTKNNLWTYNTANGSLQQITEGGRVKDASFSPNSDTILYETTSGDPANKLGSDLSLMKVDGSGKTPLNITGKVARSAWKDNNSFYLPSNNNTLLLYNTKGNPEQVSFNFPENLSIQGMVYFASTKTLIFYTSTAIYTVELTL